MFTVTYQTLFFCLPLYLLCMFVCLIFLLHFHRRQPNQIHRIQKFQNLFFTSAVKSISFSKNLNLIPKTQRIHCALAVPNKCTYLFGLHALFKHLHTHTCTHIMIIAIISENKRKMNSNTMAFYFCWLKT